MTACYFIGTLNEREKHIKLTTLCVAYHFCVTNRVELNFCIAKCLICCFALLCFILLYWFEKVQYLKCVHPLTNTNKTEGKNYTTEKDKQLNAVLKIAWISIYWCKMVQYYILRYFCIKSLAHTHTLHTYMGKWTGIIYSYYSESKVDQLLIGLYI